LEIPKSAIIANLLFEAVHHLEVVFSMSRVYPAITILCVTMVADGQFRIFPEVPVKAIRADNQTQAISEIGCNRTCYEVDQSPRLASFVPIIEIFTAAYRTSIDNIVRAVRFRVPQYYLFPASFARHHALIPRGIGSRLGKTVAAAKKDLHDLRPQGIEARDGARRTMLLLTLTPLPAKGMPGFIPS
jgi:hypothetical protein